MEHRVFRPQDVGNLHASRIMIETSLNTNQKRRKPNVAACQAEVRLPHPVICHLPRAGFGRINLRLSGLGPSVLSVAWVPSYPPLNGRTPAGLSPNSEVGPRQRRVVRATS